MSTNTKRIKRRRLARALMVAIVLAASVAAWLGNRDEQAPEAPLVKQPDCNRFLFIEQRTDAGGRTFFVLVQVKITPEGLEQREVRVQGRLRPQWQPACVVRGKVYGRGYNSLQAVNLRTGAVETIHSKLEPAVHSSRVSDYCVGDKLYAVVTSGGKPMMRVFDLRRRSYRDIAPFSVPRGPVWPFAVLPDHQRVAYFVSQPGGTKRPMFPPAWLIKSVNFVLRRPAPLVGTSPSYYQLNVIHTDTAESEKPLTGCCWNQQMPTAK